MFFAYFFSGRELWHCRRGWGCRGGGGFRTQIQNIQAKLENISKNSKTSKHKKNILKTCLFSYCFPARELRHWRWGWGWGRGAKPFLQNKQNKYIYYSIYTYNIYIYIYLYILIHWFKDLAKFRYWARLCPKFEFCERSIF